MNIETAELDNKRCIHLWDPNEVNPYGVEICSILRSAGVKVRIWRPRTGPELTSCENTGPNLATSSKQDGLARHIALRLCRPLQVVFYALVHKDEILVLWTRGIFENIVFAMAANIVAVSTVHHNPDPRRRQKGLREPTFQYLLRHSRKILVHSELLMKHLTPNQRSRGAVVMHPLYRRWRTTFGGPRIPHGNKVCVLFLGALRKDKGANLLPDIAARLDPNVFSLMVVGSGRLPEDFMSECEAMGLHLIRDVQEGPVSDEAIALALSRADVLLAPYSEATVSGTLLLAETMDVPTIAFNSGALSDDLTPGAMTSPTTEDLVERLMEWVDTPFSTYLRNDQERMSLEIKSWKDSLA